MSADSLSHLQQFGAICRASLAPAACAAQLEPTAADEKDGDPLRAFSEACRADLQAHKDP